MNILKQSTSVVINLGPFVDYVDGVTLKTGLVSALDHASTGIMLSKNGGTLAVRHASVTASTYDAHGCYKVTLDTTDTGTLGTLRVIYTDATTCLPVWRDFDIVPAAVYDCLVSGTDYLAANTVKLNGTTCTARDIGASVLLSSGSGTGQLDFTSGVVKSNVTQLLGTAWLTPGTAGTPDVNVKLWNGLTTVALPLVPTIAGRTLDVSTGGEAGLDWANIGSPTTTVSLSGTTVKTATDVETATTNIQGRIPAALGANGNIKADVRDYNGTAGTFAGGRAEVNMTHIAGSAVSTSTAQLGVNVVNFGGSAGTFSGGRPETNATHWGGTAVASAIVQANAAQISGDATAADNFETMLDGTGGQTFSLGKLVVSTSSGSAVSIVTDDPSQTAMVIASTALTGDGNGLDITASGAGYGIFLTGSAVLNTIVGSLSGTIGGLTAAALKDFFDTNSGTTYASAVTGSVVKEIADNAAGGGGGGTDWTSTEKAQIRYRLGLDGSTNTPSATPTLPVDAVAISGDSTAADYLETMLDGTGGHTLSLGALAISGTTTLSGAVSLGSTLTVTGATTLVGAVGLSSTLTITGATTFTGAVTLSSTLGTGAVTLGSLTVTGATALNSTTISSSSGVGLTITSSADKALRVYTTASDTTGASIEGNGLGHGLDVAIYGAFFGDINGNVTGQTSYVGSLSSGASKFTANCQVLAPATTV